MSAKQIVIPNNKVDVPDDKGGTKKAVRFIYLATIVTENTPHKTSTDAYLAHSIREKLDGYRSENFIELEEAEVKFLEDGIEFLRTKQQVTGSGWYDLIVGLREAKDKPRMTKVK